MDCTSTIGGRVFESSVCALGGKVAGFLCRSDFRGRDPILRILACGYSKRKSDRNSGSCSTAVCEVFNVSMHTLTPQIVEMLDRADCSLLCPVLSRTGLFVSVTSSEEAHNEKRFVLPPQVALDFSYTALCILWVVYGNGFPRGIVRKSTWCFWFWEEVFGFGFL